jgi:hypothetical protein
MVEAWLDMLPNDDRDYTERVAVIKTVLAAFEDAGILETLDCLHIGCFTPESIKLDMVSLTNATYIAMADQTGNFINLTSNSSRVRLPVPIDGNGSAGDNNWHLGVRCEVTDLLLRNAALAFMAIYDDINVGIIAEFFNTGDTTSPYETRAVVTTSGLPHGELGYSLADTKQIYQLNNLANSESTYHVDQNSVSFGAGSLAIESQDTYVFAGGTPGRTIHGKYYAFSYGGALTEAQRASYYSAMNLL